MGLKEVMEDTRKQLEEAEKLESAAVEVEEKPIEEPKVEDPAPEEKPAEEPAKEEPKPEEPVKTASDYARERRENRAAAKLAEELAAANARIAELTRPREAVTPVNLEPDRAENPQEWTEWKIKQQDAIIRDLSSRTEQTTREEQSRRIRAQAEQEVVGYENQVRAQNPDYDAAKSYYANMLAASIKIINPKVTNNQLVQAVNDKLMLRASELLNEGHENPIAAMYEEVKALGFQPPKAQEPSTEKEIKPDLAKVAANRARNAGTAAAQGDGGRGDLTPKVAATLTNKEFAKLKPEEKARIFQQLQQAG